MIRRSNFDIEYIGHTLMNLRKKNSYSVKDIRDYLGLSSVQSIYRIEHGKQMPSADSLLALMELYNLKATDFIRQENCRKSD